MGGGGAGNAVSGQQGTSPPLRTTGAHRLPWLAIGLDAALARRRFISAAMAARRRWGQTLRDAAPPPRAARPAH